MERVWKKANGESGRLPSGSSTPDVAWLPGTHENSNYILPRIPIEIHLLKRGLLAIGMDSHRLREVLGLREQEIESLRQVGLVLPMPRKPPPRIRVNYVALQQPYSRMLADGSFASQSDLVRPLGVSRVWVSRVLKW